MSSPQLLCPPLDAPTWRIVTEASQYERSSRHTLYYGKRAIETRTGPHNLRLLTEICNHLNATGGKPELPKPKPSTNQNQTFLF